MSASCPLFPMFQLGKILVKLTSAFFLWRIIRVWHMRYQKINQASFGRISESPIGIAPLAIVLIEAAVWFPADGTVFIERHATALADELSWSTKKRIDGYIKFL